MIEYVRNQCQEYNIGVRCECYDGQFLNLIKFDENGQPLNQLTFLQKMYNDLTKWSKEQCINFILNEAIPNGIPISQIVTPDKIQILRRHCQQVMDRRSRHIACNQDKLDSDDITILMSCSKLGRRIAQRVTSDTTDNLSSDEDSDDEDYIYHDSDVDSVYSSEYEASDYFLQTDNSGNGMLSPHFEYWRKSHNLHIRNINCWNCNCYHSHKSKME